MDEVTRFSMEGDKNPAARLRTAVEVTILREQEAFRIREAALGALHDVIREATEDERDRIRNLALAMAARISLSHEPVSAVNAMYDLAAMLAPEGGGE